MNRILCAAACVLSTLTGASGALAQSAAPSDKMTFFVTSVGLGRGGDLGGLAGADAHCQALAAAVGAGGHTRPAYLSTPARSRNWGRRKTPSFRQTLPNFTETRWSRRSAAAIYSNSPRATSMDR